LRKVSSFLRLWLSWFLLILAVSSAVLFPFLLRFEEARRDFVEKSYASQLVTADHIVPAVFRERLGDIRVLARLLSTHAFPGEWDAGQREDILRLLREFCTAYKQYGQVRLVKAGLGETLGVDFRGGECRAFQIPEAQGPQYESLLLRARGLSPGDVAISPMELSVAGVGSSEPPRPTIAFFTAILDEDGLAPRGVLELHYLAQSLFDELFVHKRDAVTAEDHADFLMNSAGGYLLSEIAPEHAFAFQTEGDDRSFDNDYPDAWQALLDGESSLRSDRGLFLLKSIPVPVSRIDSPGPAGAATEPRYWHLARFVPNRVLYEDSILFGSNRYVWLALYLAIIAFVAMLWAERRLWRSQMLVTLDSLTNTISGIENSGIALHSLDYESGKLIDVSENMASWLGYSQREMLGKPIWEVDSNLDAESYLEIRQQIRDGARMSFDTTHRHRDGHLVPVEITVAFRAAARGRPAHMLAMAKNISERRFAENALRETNALLETVIDYIPASIFW